MSEEGATLFWEIDLDPAPDHKSDNVDPILPTRAAPTDEVVAPKKVLSIGSMPTS